MYLTAVQTQDPDGGPATAGLEDDLRLSRERHGQRRAAKHAPVLAVLEAHGS
jgi:hypothetical protein